MQHRQETGRGASHPWPFLFTDFRCMMITGFYFDDNTPSNVSVAERWAIFGYGMGWEKFHAFLREYGLPQDMDSAATDAGQTLDRILRLSMDTSIPPEHRLIAAQLHKELTGRW